MDDPAGSPRAWPASGGASSAPGHLPVAKPCLAPHCLGGPGPHSLLEGTVTRVNPGRKCVEFLDRRMLAMVVLGGVLAALWAEPKFFFFLNSCFIPGALIVTFNSVPSCGIFCGALEKHTCCGDMARGPLRGLDSRWALAG